MRVWLLFFHATAPTELYTYWHTLSLHGSLPIGHPARAALQHRAGVPASPPAPYHGPAAQRDRQTPARRPVAPAGRRRRVTGFDTPACGYRHAVLTRGAE